MTTQMPAVNANSAEARTSFNRIERALIIAVLQDEVIRSSRHTIKIRIPGTEQLAPPHINS